MVKARSIVLLLALICGIGVIPVNHSVANEITTVLKYPDDSYNVNWILTIKYQQSITCSWGEFNPATSKGAMCKVPFTYSLDWELNPETGMKLSNPWLPTRELLSPKENQVTLVNQSGESFQPTSFIKFVSVYGDRKKVKSAVLNVFSVNPTDFYFTIKPYFNKSLVVQSNQVGGQFVHALRSQAIEEYNGVARAESAQIAELQAAKKITINCVKGKARKYIIGDPAKCPSGYINPQAVYPTFTAFSECKLYKKDSVSSGAKLEDGGKTLTLPYVGKYDSIYNALTNADLTCAFTKMKAPSYVLAQLGNTRAIDGMQTATWGKVTAIWNYHPDSGTNITFTTK